MDIEEQKNLAKSYNLSTISANELIHLLQKDIKSKFGINSKIDDGNKYNLMETWAQEEFDRLVSQGMNESEAEEQAMDYAEELLNQTTNSIRNIPPYHIWTIEKEIDDAVYESVLKIKENQNLDIKLFTFDAKYSSLVEYEELFKTFGEPTAKNVLLVKNFALGKGILFENLRDDVKKWPQKNYYTIITSPIISEEHTQSLSGLGVCHKVLISE